MTTLQDCPECALPAEVYPRGRLAATDGALEHVFVRCVVGHWFLGPIARVIGETNDRSRPHRPPRSGG